MAHKTEPVTRNDETNRESSEPEKRSSSAMRLLYLTLRDLHLYIGLFIGPFLILYSLSAILFLHRWMPRGGPSRANAETRTASVQIPDEEDSLRLAKAILRQVDADGEVALVHREADDRRIEITVEKPGERTVVTVDGATGTATVERKRTGFWDAIAYLHARPGQHMASLRGNWFPMKLWGWTADGIVYAILFVTATGVYLWTTIRAERRVGLICLGAGALTFVVLLMTIVG